MTEGDSELLEVRLGQVRQDRRIDRIRLKHSRVLPETELIEPIGDAAHGAASIHDRRLMVTSDPIQPGHYYRLQNQRATAS